MTNAFAARMLSPTLEMYDGASAYRYQDPAHAERAAELALAALELDVKRFEGQGSTRRPSRPARMSAVPAGLEPSHHQGIVAEVSDWMWGMVAVATK